LRLSSQTLEAHGYRAFFHERLPINDASLALGQAAVLAHHINSPAFLSTS
jgi:hydrogenase maturation factor HypF (carbamoyltransferase family)